MKKIKGKEKVSIKETKINISLNNKENKENYINLRENEYIVKEIAKDGNCFYRTLSYYFREREDDYKEFRNLISEYIMNNQEKYIPFITDDQISINSEFIDNIEYINKKKKEYIIDYGKNVSKNGTFAGDIEINTACLIFNCNIRLYIMGDGIYTLFNEFNNNLNSLSVIDNINILFINNNHFNLLIPKSNIRDEIISNIYKNLDMTEIAKQILNSKKLKSTNFKNSININNDKKFVDYQKKGLNRYYDEIKEYIMSNKMPIRLSYEKGKNKKTIENKRNRFLKMVKTSYRIFDNRLQYRYYYKKDFIWLNIPYKEEIKSMLYYLHNKNNHLKHEAMSREVISMGFYWNGYTNDINNTIKECGICYCKNNAKMIPVNPKIILTYGPKVRYQCDLWYLNYKLKQKNDYEYIIDIIDHYSKFMLSYLLKNKTADLVLSKIKNFMLVNGDCKIFQTDNGLEFNNHLLKIFLENKNILYLRSAPYHPQSNGCCEAVHKEIKKFLNNYYEKNKYNFNIEIALEEAIEYHNTRIIDATKYSPIFLRENYDKDLVDQVIRNIISSMKRKIEKKLNFQKILYY